MRLGETVEWGNGVSRRLLLEADGLGYTLTDTLVLAGSRSLLHYPHHLEACYCISGTGWVTDTAGRSHRLEPGVLYALDEHDAHILEADSDGDMRLVCVFAGRKVVRILRRQPLPRKKLSRCPHGRSRPRLLPRSSATSATSSIATVTPATPPRASPGRWRRPTAARSALMPAADLMSADARQNALVDEFAAWHERLNAVGEGAPACGLDPRKWVAVRESGILRLPFERRFGGRGEDLLTTMRVLEDLGHGCRDGGLAFSICTHIVTAGIALQRFGSEQLKQRYLPRVCDGSAIGAHAITEADAGSDVLAMQTRAVDRGDHFVIDGAKAFVTNAPVADVFVVYAVTRPDAGPLGITAFVVDRDTPGVRTGDPIPKMGLDGSPVGELVLDGCEIAADRVLGRSGSGFLTLEHVLKWEILCTFSACVGAMQHRLERCLDHAARRRQFGRPIGAFQAVSHKIVDMKIGVQTARRWLYDTAALFIAGKDTPADIAIAKLVASEANVASALAAVQIFGASGYTTSTGLEAELRDAIAGTIYSGTSEIQRNRIAATLGLRDRSPAEHALELR